ncbi:MAG: hypothetical protein ACYS7Y_33940 [Planctomycetota bacterium]|jgi:hypothetical protein
MGQVTEQYTRQKIGELAVKVAAEYCLHANLAAYATMRVNGTLNLPIGTRDRSWWTILMDECVARRDAYEQVAKWLRTDLGVRVSLPQADWAKGMEIYIKEFVLEGSEQTFDEYVKAIGLDWTRDDGDFLERDPQPAFYGSREFEAPGSAGAPDIPPPESD